MIHLLLDLAKQAPEWLHLVVGGVLIFAAAAVLGQAAAVVMILMERKVLAWLTQRVGPNRVGPYGALQSIADGIKIVFKEDIMTPIQDKFLFTLAPAVFLFPVFALYTLIPFSESLTGVVLPISLLTVFAISSLSTLGLVLAGWSSNNKFSLMGGMRSAAQAISYEIPLVLSVLGLVLFTGSLNLVDIVKAQSGGVLSWHVWVLSPLSFLLFYVSSLAEINRVPFDLPEAESELVSGYNTEYSGMKFATFFLAEYAALFFYSALIATLFFGGYYSPFGGLLVSQLGVDAALVNATHLPLLGKLLREGEMLVWMLSKTYVFIYLAMLIRGTLPRLKPDQLMNFSWKFLIPVALINVLMLACGKLFQQSLAAHGWQGPGTWVYLALTLLVAVVGLGGFFQFISRYFKGQMQARLANPAAPLVS